MRLRRLVYRFTADGIIRRLLLQILRHKAPAKRARIEEGVLYLEHDAGFFSNCSIALLEISRSSEVIRQVDNSNSFGLYKTQPGQNNWEAFFSPPGHTVPHANRSEFAGFLLNHSRYTLLNLSAAQETISSFFSPSEEVLSRRAELIQRYEIDFGATIAVHYRGTDKEEEVKSEGFDRWLEEVDKARSMHKTKTRILVQTDQAQFLELCIRKFGHSVLYFEEMQASTGKIGSHFLLAPEERESFGQWFLAAILVISQCSRVITHTGNGAFWTVLYRGNTKGLIQIP